MRSLDTGSGIGKYHSMAGKGTLSCLLTRLIVTKSSPLGHEFGCEFTDYIFFWAVSNFRAFGYAYYVIIKSVETIS